MSDCYLFILSVCVEIINGSFTSTVLPLASRQGVPLSQETRALLRCCISVYHYIDTSRNVSLI